MTDGVTTIGRGDVAPDFELKDQDKNLVRLSDFRGKKVLLMFYPYAFSGICTPEVCEVRDRRAETAGRRHAGPVGVGGCGARAARLQGREGVLPSRC